MSSAILYAAIIAIWAGVLIPRWLKRDTSRASAAAATLATADGQAAAESAGPATQTAGRKGGRGSQPDAAQHGRGKVKPRIVAARRRMLVILITLTMATLGVAALKMAAWWVAAPPVLMLGGYLTLLREASRADRERALLDAAGGPEDQPQRDVPETTRGAAQPAAAAQTARVIDISERVRDDDEIYDQYADGPRRAVAH